MMGSAMKAVFCFGSFSTACCLLAAEDATVNSARGVDFNWTDLTALAIVAITLCFIVIKMLPDLHAKFIEQSKLFALVIENSQRSFAEILDKMHSRVEDRDKVRHEDQQKFSEALTELTAQCARRQAAELGTKG
jgi:hypothetical protein